MLKDNLKLLREKNNFTKKQVADAIGVTERAYITYEYGQRDVSTETLQRLADFYRVTTDYLLGRPEATPPIDGLSEMIAQNAANDIEKTLLEMYFGLDAKKRGAFLQELVDVVNQNQKTKEAQEEDGE